jgi:hypothetical protein
LESHVPAYLATKDTSRRGFWFTLFSAWWILFPWKLADNEDPPTVQAELTRLATVGPGEQDAKKEVEQKLTEVRRIYIRSYQSRC